MSLSKTEQDRLLAIARDAIAQVIGLGKGSGNPEPFSIRAGAFVSLHIGKNLRGCVGYPESDQPLVDVVRRSAMSAATADSRFPPLDPAEWPHVSLEISVLTPAALVADIAEIEVGRHGLIAQLGHRRGLLLPQVATEWGWDREEFASQTCRKAGLSSDAWRTGAQLFKFEAQVFADSSAH